MRAHRIAWIALAECVSMLGLGIPVPAHAKTIIAYPGNNSIYFAVEASSAGDSILVMPGVYPYEIGVDIHHSLTIVGVGGASRNNVEICSDLCLTYLFGIYSDASSAVSIEGLNITRSNLYPGTVRGILLATSAYTTIADCVFHDLQDRAIIVFGSGPVPPRIEGNLFYGNQTGIDFRSGRERSRAIPLREPESGFSSTAEHRQSLPTMFSPTVCEGSCASHPTRLPSQSSSVTMFGTIRRAAIPAVKIQRERMATYSPIRCSAIRVAISGFYPSRHACRKMPPRGAH